MKTLFVTDQHLWGSNQVNFFNIRIHLSVLKFNINCLAEEKFANERKKTFNFLVKEMVVF